MNTNKLFEKILRLLDSGRVRYSDRIFEEKRIKLVQEIKDCIQDSSKPEPAVSSEEKTEPKRVYLPVVRE